MTRWFSFRRVKCHDLTGSRSHLVTRSLLPRDGVRARFWRWLFHKPTS